MRTLISFLLGGALVLGCDLALADRPGKPVVKLHQKGQWVELRDLDPVPSNREVRHIWLHRGTLLFDVTRLEDGSPFRDAITYFGLPVRFLAKKRRGGWHIENIEDPIRSSFHLTRNVFCPGETNPILLRGNCLRGGTPLGEGYVFDLHILDADGDGVADRKGGQDFFEASVLLDATTAAALEVDRRFVFPIFKKDLDQYESDGVLFRLDRTHPQREVRFLDSNYQPCGSTESSEIRKAKALEIYSKAEGKAGFDFWGWLSASFTVGASATATETDADSIKLTTTTASGTTFRQWGLIFDYSIDPNEPEHQTPFFIEKVFECVNDVGQISFGDRIKRVEIGLLDRFTGKNNVFEFTRPDEFQVFDDKVLDKVDKPVFISINDSESQAAALDAIKDMDGIEDHYIAALVFAQLNLACPENNRKECHALLAKNVD